MIQTIRILISICTLLILSNSLFSVNYLKNTKLPIYTFQIIKQYNHFPQAFTQGLYLDSQGRLYESAGLYQHSKLIQYDLNKNKVIKTQSLPSSWFAEGITLLNNKLYLSLFQSKYMIIFDKESFRQIGYLRTPIAGWGLTTDGKHLILSDGSANINFVDPSSRRVVRTIIVRDREQLITDLNAIQFVDNKIYANIWHTDLIAIIDAKVGLVLGWIDLAGLNPNPQSLNGEYVLNGIAYDRSQRLLLVTGKFWPFIYALRLQLHN